MELSDYAMTREPVPHGDISFHLKVHEFRTDVSRPERVSSHWHDEYELLAITAGCGSVRVNGSVFPAAEGDIFFLDSGSMHSLSAGLGQRLDICAVVFGLEMLSSYGSDLIQQQYVDSHRNGTLRFRTVFRRGDEVWPCLHCTVEEIRGLARQGHNELLIKSDILRVWHYLCCCPETDCAAMPAPDSRPLLLTKQILQYIHAHYMEDISLAALSSRFNMSGGQFCRFFKSHVNMTAVEYLNYYRIGASCSLLRQPDMAVGDAAVRVGYSNISYFNRMFRRYMHCTPREYKRDSCLP